MIVLSNLGMARVKAKAMQIMDEKINRPTKRLDRERRTLQLMIELYCHDQHHPQAHLCDDCQELLDYAVQRIDKCPFQAEKPTCAKCPVHCYKPAMREKVRQVMRYSGPRMLIYHPALAALHLWEGIFPLEKRERRSNNIK